jgi:hypothetical protein
VALKNVIRLIPLKDGSFAKVSQCDYKELSSYSWSRDKGGYVRRGEYDPKTMKMKTVFMHKQVLSIEGIVDHKDRNKLHNFRSNLRPCNHNQNMMNSDKYVLKKGATSKYKGVSWHSLKNKWVVHAVVDGKQKTLGYYDLEEQAGLVYNQYAIKYYGEFAVLNDIDESSVPPIPVKYKGIWYDYNREKYVVTANGKQLGRYSTFIEAFNVRTEWELANNKPIQEWRGEMEI